jgi:hypothetical protein
MDRKEWAKNLYEDLGGDELFNKKGCSFEELYSFISDNWAYALHLELNDSLLQWGMDISLNRLKEKQIKDSEYIDIEEDFMLKFLVGAALVIGLGYGVYKALNRENKNALQTKPDLLPEEKRRDSGTQQERQAPPVKLKPFLIMAVKKSELERLYPDFSSKGSFIINDPEAFYKLSWFLLSDQDQSTIASIQAKTGSGAEFDNAILSINVSTFEMMKLRKGSSTGEKRKAFENFKGKEVTVLGAVNLDEIDLPFYSMG